MFICRRVPFLNMAVTPPQLVRTLTQSMLPKQGTIPTQARSICSTVIRSPFHIVEGAIGRIQQVAWESTKIKRKAKMNKVRPHTKLKTC
jgi:hypothetical protein